MLYVLKNYPQIRVVNKQARPEVSEWLKDENHENNKKYQMEICANQEPDSGLCPVDMWPSLVPTGDGVCVSMNADVLL